MLKKKHGGGCQRGIRKTYCDLKTAQASQKRRSVKNTVRFKDYYYVEAITSGL